MSERAVPAGPSRRAVARGAAWSVPAVAIAGAAPAFAASGSGCTVGSTLRHTALAPSTSSSNAVTSSWRVPDGVRFVCFEVAGGGGGGTAARVGGSGARITGRLAVTPGETLTLTVAAGGMRQVETTGGGGPGGGGYGTGGSTQASVFNHGGSGGGGSAILRGGSNGTPLVVAGGGGGAGGDRRFVDAGWTYRGGEGGSVGSNGTEFYTYLNGNTNVWGRAPGGIAASGATPGGQTAVPTFGSSNRLVYTNPVRGAAATGRNGANGVTCSTQFDVNDYNFQSGAGGGGYAGGGSGAALGLRTDYYAFNERYQIRVYERNAIGGGGGPGSNFTGGVAVLFGQSLAGNGGNAEGRRNPGWIRLYY